MKIKSAERLLFVAIATSAIVAQIRLNTLPSPDAPAAVQQSAQDHRGTHGQTCDADHDHGMLRATCAMRDEHRPADAVDTPRANRLWV